MPTPTLPLRLQPPPPPPPTTTNIHSDPFLPQGTNVLLITLAFVGFILILTGLLYLVLTDNRFYGKHNAENRQATVILKVVLNHMQLLGLLVQLDLPWPSAIEAPLWSLESAVNFNLYSSAFRCLFGDGFATYAIFYLCIPLVVFLVTAATFGARWWYNDRRGRPKYLKEPLVTSNTAVAFLLYPILLRVCASMFMCTDAGEGPRLIQNPAYECYTAHHYIVMVLAGVPVAVVCGVLGPRHVLLGKSRPVAWQILGRRGSLESASDSHNDSAVNSRSGSNSVGVLQASVSAPLGVRVTWEVLVVCRPLPWGCGPLQLRKGGPSSWCELEKGREVWETGSEGRT